ncbi:MAG: hypothetical protein UU22_C0035G0003 [Parcubacteria group bacterium GW2011_GWA2_40_8]|nr:MAG: hypothetical protein UU22_C0035G0003 [Parcubacteria group bacterium GW2011_GWA2_40_8]
MRPEISAGAVIFRRYKKRREYLLLHYGSGHWDFAKGHLEGEETAQVAAKREIYEETGLRNLRFYPDYKENIKYWMWPYRHKQARSQVSAQTKPTKILKIVTFFLAESLSSAVRLSHEHSGYVWLPYKEALKMITYNSAKDLIKKAENTFTHGNVSGK